MAKKQTNSATTLTHRDKPKKKRKGVHAKTKSSKNKNSTNYVKPYKKQGV